MGTKKSTKHTEKDPESRPEHLTRRESLALLAPMVPALKLRAYVKPRILHELALELELGSPL